MAGCQGSPSGVDKVDFPGLPGALEKNVCMGVFSTGPEGRGSIVHFIHFGLAEGPNSPSGCQGSTAVVGKVDF